MTDNKQYTNTYITYIYIYEIRVIVDPGCLIEGGGYQ